MNLFRKGEGEKKLATHPMFLGTVYIRSLTATPNEHLNASVVSFDESARNTFHTHDTDQILVVTEGEGTIATEAEEFPMSAGDVVYIPAGESHWHGARPGKTMTHISIIAAKS
jgi:quercetin dioxygenase-like cupin family protein